MSRVAPSRERTPPTPLPAARTSLTERLFEPVDIDFLAYFRVLFGAVMVYQVLSYFMIAPGGRTYLTDYYIRPFHFHYYGFEWVRPWSGGGMHLHMAVLAALAAGIMFGVLYRVSSLLFCFGWVYFFLLDRAYYQNHYYLVCLLSGWMAVFPAHREFSLDASMRPSIRASTIPAWILWALRIQLGIPYFFGGIAKINSDWLHGEPMRTWILSGRYAYIPESLRNETAVYLFTYGGMLFDLLVVPALLWRRTRMLACAAAIFFHLSNHFIYPIGIFPWLMLGSLVLYFPPGSIRRLLGVWPVGEPAPNASRRQPLNWRQKAAVGLLAAVTAFQSLWPLRHHLYPGDAGWTGEGDLFAWRMMLYNKSGETPVFQIVDPDGKLPTESIDCRQFLNRQQSWSLVLSPDHLLQFAQFVHREILAPQGLARMQVRAIAPVRYNGREAQQIVDPEIDLARVPRRLFGTAEWIVPLAHPLPEPGSKRRGGTLDQLPGEVRSE